MSDPTGAGAGVSPAAVGPRVRGTRTRAGNAMGRTRSALVSAVSVAVEKHGLRRATMGDIAAAAGIAKATLYNHFRTKPEVLAAAVAGEVTALGEACEALAAERAHAAVAVGTHPALRRVVAEEPAALMPLLDGGASGARPVNAGAGGVAEQAIRRVLVAGGAGADAPAVELVRRWVASHIARPAAPDAVAEAAELLAAGLLTAGAAAASAAGSAGALPDAPPDAGAGADPSTADLPS